MSVHDLVDKQLEETLNQKRYIKFLAKINAISPWLHAVVQFLISGIGKLGTSKLQVYSISNEPFAMLFHYTYSNKIVKYSIKTVSKFNYTYHSFSLPIPLCLTPWCMQLYVLAVDYLVFQLATLHEYYA